MSSPFRVDRGRADFRRPRRALIWAVVAALLASPAVADEIALKGGGRVSGEIVERTETALKVDIGAGRITVPLESVVEIREGSSPLGEYRERAAALAPGDVTGWRELARWASKEGLAHQAREAYSRVLTSMPDDPEANRALGRVHHDGRWMKEADAYRAECYVEFEGEWLLPEERQAILDERAASEARNREELEAEIRAGEEEIQAEREREEAERAAWWDETRVSGSGDGLVYWDWGMGPNLWPSEADEPSGPRGFGE